MRAQMLGLMLALAPLTVGWAATDAEQDKHDCKQHEQEKGAGEKKSAVVCAVKALFQSRIRRKQDAEPIEMTVGSPPMQTDDTDTPGPGTWETNLVAHADLAGAARRIQMPNIDINYGSGDTLQFKYEVPYVLAKHLRDNEFAQDLDAHGVGDSIVGVKYRFYDDKEAGLSFAIYPQIQFKTPGANKRVSEEPTTLILPVIVTREFERASITANAGLEATESERRYFASFGVGTRVSDRVALLAEVVGTNINAADEKHVALNVGVRRKISATQTLSAALGRDIYAGGDQREQTYLTFAFQMSFGK